MVARFIRGLLLCALIFAPAPAEVVKTPEVIVSPSAIAEAIAASLSPVNKEPALSPIPVRKTLYPLRAGWWTVRTAGVEQPATVEHLSTGQHAGKFDRAWLESLSFDELQSLHADDHENKVNYQFARRPKPKPAPAAKASAPKAGGCKWVLMNGKWVQVCPNRR